MNLTKYSKSLKILVVLFLIVLIFSYTFFDDQKVVELTDELGFYQTNTCKHSLFEFQLNNLKTTFQDHYIVNVNNYSDISCYGKISAIDRVKDTFYISVGFNPLVNLAFTSLLLSFIFYISSKEKKESEVLNFKFFISLFLTSGLFTYGIISETRFYARKLLYLDLTLSSTYITIFLFFLFSIYFINFYFLNSSEKLINYFPYLYLFIGVINGFNLNIFYLIFIFYWIQEMLKNSKLLKYNIILFIWISFWISQIENNNYYLDPDKIVGSSSTVYNIHSTIFWSILFFYTLLGVISYVKNNIGSINLQFLNKSFLNAGTTLFLFGLATSKFSTLNALSLVLFGQNKITTRDFDLNFFYSCFNTDLAQSAGRFEGCTTRGFSPSAEHIGEFYGIILIFYFLNFYYKKIKSNIFDYPKLFIVFLGLLISNNKAAIYLVALFCLYPFLKKLPRKRAVMFLLVLIICFLSIIGIDNYLHYSEYGEYKLFSIKFSSSKILSEGKINSFEGAESKSIEYLSSAYNNNNYFVIFILGLISTFAFYINRGNLWGMFIARYNPSPVDLVFGTGPYNLSKVYNEVKIIGQSDFRGDFLLTHSSLIQVLIYFGFIGLLVLFYEFYKILKERNKFKNNLIMFAPFLFLVINLLKSDSIFYFSTLFTLLFFYTVNKSSYKI
tara:strand:+ start:1112 stop:3115 length:2004 start_codon:yes stop_codon:yes gene_type:complete